MQKGTKAYSDVGRGSPTACGHGTPRGVVCREFLLHVDHEALQRASKEASEGANDPIPGPRESFEGENYTNLPCMVIEDSEGSLALFSDSSETMKRQCWFCRNLTVWRGLSGLHTICGLYR